MHTHQIIWPVWRDSARSPVGFTPITKREAVKRWHDARLLEQQTRRPRHQDGAIGRSGLLTLHAILFDLTDRASGRCEPTRARIAAAAGISISSVTRGLGGSRRRVSSTGPANAPNELRTASTASRSGRAPISCGRKVAGRAWAGLK
jgi:hypothetical protein